MFINYASSSGQLSATSQITVLPGALLGIDVTPPTTGFATLLIYDSEDSNISGKKIISEVLVDAGYHSVNHEYFSPQAVNRGIYCTLTGTGVGAGAHYYIRFILG